MHCCKKKVKEPSNAGFNFLFIKRFWKILKILIPGITSLTACLLAFLLLSSCMDKYLAYHVGMFGSHFIAALVDRKFDSYFHTLILALLVMILKGAMFSFVVYIGSVLYIAWRQLLTTHLHRIYFSCHNYFYLNIFNKTIDNPDQRITQDVDKMCQKLGSILPKIIITPITIGYYSKKSYDVGGSRAILSVFGFFFAFSIINKFLISSVSRTVARLEKKEGNFRFQHVNVRSNAEAIAFQNGGRMEMTKSNRSLSKLTNVMQRLYNQEFILSTSMELAAYISSLLSYISIAFPIFSGQYDKIDSGKLSGMISANSFVTMYLIGELTVFINIAVDVSVLIGTTHRIGQLIEELDAIDPKATYENIKDKNSIIESYEGFGLKASSLQDEINDEVWLCKLSNITLYPPGERRPEATPFIKDLNMEISLGTNLLISGKSGCGKTSLLRLIKGLWHQYSGSISRSPDIMACSTKVLFLPQKPVLTEGSLLDQITYPSIESNNTSQVTSERSVTFFSDLMRWIEIADLMEIYTKCGGLEQSVDWHWEEVLSPGEVQRLAFLRLFCHLPKYAILDEATSAISCDVEQNLYEECINLGITLISVGHRDSLKKYHQYELKLSKNGSWAYQPLSS